MLKILIILGSTREGRRGKGIAEHVLEVAAKRKEADFELVDLKDYPLPFYDEQKGGPSGLNGEYKNEVAKKWWAKVKEADGYLIVTPEYNHGYPAVLKNALDYVYDEWNNKPVAFVSYGGVSGGVRAVEQLRQVAVELQLFPIRTGVHLAGIWNGLNEEGKVKDEKFEEKLGYLLEELIPHTKALEQFRDKIDQ